MTDLTSLIQRLNDRPSIIVYPHETREDLSSRIADLFRRLASALPLDGAAPESFSKRAEILLTSIINVGAEKTSSEIFTLNPDITVINSEAVERSVDDVRNLIEHHPQSALELLERWNAAALEFAIESGSENHLTARDVVRELAEHLRINSLQAIGLLGGWLSTTTSS